MTAKTSNNVKPRMSKSANVERDTGSESLDGYIPTGRVLDVVRRIASGMTEPSAGRAFSITGPYGSGKSSFAVFLGALLDSKNSASFRAAFKQLEKADKELSKLWLESRSNFSSAGSISRAFVTAKTEPLVVTLGRALENSGLPGKDSKKSPASGILERVRTIASHGPLVILVDEFGKNLEAFGDERATGDPYLLQEIAELSQGSRALPIILITMKHLAFDEYVMDAGSTQRKEWAKVQGRFHDIGFVDSPDQSYLLIAALFEPQASVIARKVDAWYRKRSKELLELNLEVALSYAKQSFPLHPVALVALPDLCARFGQSERTLFSFLGGSEPGALPSLEVVSANSEVQFVGLDSIYDYFVSSAGSFIGASHSASRWIEVETRIRDAGGLQPDERAMLKSIGVLNLLSAGGQFRASHSMLKVLWRDCINSDRKFDSVLDLLIERGLITHREFADEYRVWSGSDFNLRAAIEAERRNLQDVPTSVLLSSVALLEPVVAGRHSQAKGVLRVFPRFIVGATVQQEFLDSLDPTFDGQILLAQEVLPSFSSTRATKPVLIALGRSDFDVRVVAIEVEALKRVLGVLRETGEDWVAIHEVGERLAHATAKLNSLLDSYWDTRIANWYLLNEDSTLQQIQPHNNLSSLLSSVSDVVYHSTPRVANEMIARRELSSQGAKARRTVVDALFTNSSLQTFGIEGYGPERAVYEAVIRAPGFHGFNKTEDLWELKNPHSVEWKKVWTALSRQMTIARNQRMSLTDLVSPLTLPPFGLKSGVLGLLSALLLAQYADDLALYEYGSLVLTVDDAVVERMLRNPDVFSVRSTGVSSGPRYEAIQALKARLVMSENVGSSSFLQVARAIFRELRNIEPFAQQTESHLSSSAREVRKAFKEAVEPDMLIFETLPKVLGIPAVPVALTHGQEFSGHKFANAIVDSIVELKGAYEGLLDRCLRTLGDGLAMNPNSEGFRYRLQGQAINVLDSILQPKLKTFAYALSRDTLDDRSWLENVAMVVCDGTPPRMWNDEQESKFQLQVTELGANFRRLQALLYDRLATSSDGFESRRITVTWPDGKEISESVAISHQEMSVMDETLGTSLKKLEEVFGSDFEARKALAAWLWVTERSSESTFGSDRGEVQGA